MAGARALGPWTSSLEHQALLNWLQLLCLYLVNPALPGLPCFVLPVIPGADFSLPGRGSFYGNFA